MKGVSLRSSWTAARLIPAVTFFLFCSVASCLAADVNVTVPSSGSVVNSPFLLQANSSSCKTQPTSGMAWSVDSQSDHQFSGSQSINTSVSMSNGTHTLRVKAWGNQGAYCEKDLALTVGGGVAVTKPVNGSTVSNPFTLQASAPTCGGQTTSSMAFSFDSQTDNMRTGATSINESVSTTPGQHLLRVKAWGNGGAFCATNLSINVSAEDVVVTTPSNNATLSSPFPIKATSTSCAGIKTSGMAWSVDSQTDNPFSGQQTIDTQATVDAGTHQLHIKAWNTSGGFCQKILNITVTGQDITVTTPSSGDDVAMTFPLQASSTTCQGLSTSSMAFSFDSLQDNLRSGQTSINENVTAPGTGAHTLRVKAWNSSGAVCVQDLDLNVINGGIDPPPDAVSSPPEIQSLGNYPYTFPNGYGPCPGHAATDSNAAFQHWLNQPDCGTVGTKSGSTDLVTAGSLPAGHPSDSADGRVFRMTTDTSGGGVRWFNHLGSDKSSNWFLYDINVYINDVSQVTQLEMDMNQAFNNSQDGTKLYIYGVQCNFTKNLWQITSGGWVDTDQACAASFHSGRWQHVQIRSYRGPTVGNPITYDAVAVDGNVVNLTCNKSQGHAACNGNPSGSAWGDGTIGPNFQINGKAGANVTAYAHQFNIYRWRR